MQASLFCTRPAPLSRPWLRKPLPGHGERGIALITALLILIMLTLLAITMFRGFGLQQKIAGNVREKERAFQAAQSALQYGEAWLMNPDSVVTAMPCDTTITVVAQSDMRVCQTGLTNSGDPSNWVGASVYTPPAMKVAAGGGTVTDGNNNLDINYAKPPKLYIAFMGQSGGAGGPTIYSVTGAGYGGSTTSVSVVQSVISRASGGATSVTGP